LTFKHDKPTEPRDRHCVTSLTSPCNEAFIPQFERPSTHHNTGNSRPKIHPKRTKIKFSCRYFAQTLMRNDKQDQRGTKPTTTQVNVKGHAHNRPQGPKGVPGRLRPRIFLTFGTTRAVGAQPHAPAAFNPRRNSWYSFLEAESTPGHMVPSVATDKNPQCDTTGNRSRDRPTGSAVP
jgi:hypothetical protein